MRVSTLLIALPALALAQQKPLQEQVQEQLQGWFDKAKSFIPQSAPSFPSVPNPVDAGAAKVADQNVVTLTKDNWKSTLTPSPTDASEGPQDWMVFVSGDNKTCFGLCDGLEQKWRVSIYLLPGQHIQAISPVFLLQA